MGRGKSTGDSPSGTRPPMMRMRMLRRLGGKAGVDRFRIGRVRVLAEFFGLQPALIVTAAKLATPAGDPAKGVAGLCVLKRR